MEDKRNEMQAKYFDYVDFATKYCKVKAADRRILSANLQHLKSAWFEALVRYRRSVKKELHS